MSVTVRYPGVEIKEVLGGVRTIVGIATSIAAFVGRTNSGPTNKPVVIESFGDFQRDFGGLGIDRPLSYAVRDFYSNGGATAIILRLHSDPDAEGARAHLAVDDVKLKAANPGAWGKSLRMSIDPRVASQARAGLGLSANQPLFNLTVRCGGVSETFINLNFADNARRIDRVLADQSSLVAWAPDEAPSAETAFGSLAVAATAIDATTKALQDATSALDAALKANPTVAADIAAARASLESAKADAGRALAMLTDPASKADAALVEAVKTGDAAKTAAAQVAVAAAEAAMSGDDGADLAPADYYGVQAAKTGFYALDLAETFNLLCIPPDVRGKSVDPDIWRQAMLYCASRQAMLLVDSPFEWNTIAAPALGNAFTGLGLDRAHADHGALYFPSMVEADPLQNGRLDNFVACGAVAGVMARTDKTAGVWKSPAGLNALINGIQGLAAKLNDTDAGLLNPLGINCLRTFPATGPVIWGARTVAGADALASEFKYVPVRRTALYIESSLSRGLQWAAFEPNDETLWSRIRLSVGTFMMELFRKGAFQGATPSNAYFVKSDRDTTLQHDIDLGVVNIMVGFAPLKPAEFVVIKLQQLAGQTQN